MFIATKTKNTPVPTGTKMKVSSQVASIVVLDAVIQVRKCSGNVAQRPATTIQEMFDVNIYNQFHNSAVNIHVET